MDKKLISLDIAGTLYNKKPTAPWGQFFRKDSEGQPHITGLAMLQLMKLAEQGHKIVINTTALDGRIPDRILTDLTNYFLDSNSGMKDYSPKQIKEFIDNNFYFSTFRGCEISKLQVEKNGQVVQKGILEESPVSAEETNWLIETIEKQYPKMIKDCVLKYGKNICPNDSENKGHCGILTLANPTPENIQKVQKIIKELGYAEIIEPDGSDVFFGQNIGKEAAVTTLGEKLGISKNDQIHIGDGKEDVMKEIDNILLDNDKTADFNKKKAPNVETALHSVINNGFKR